MSVPALDVRGATRRYASLVALDDVSLRLDPGEWVGLLGPNGAGKTTLVRAIAGLTRLDAGAVRVFGEEVREGRPSPRLGLVPQDVALYPLLTARESLEVFGGLHGVPRTELRERVDWALDWTGLADRADGRVDGFSGGMRRRLNIACAVLHRPGVVLLDEPTVGVDPHARYRIHDMLDSLRRSGTAVLQSSHQLDEIQARCDRMVVLDRGRRVAGGTLRELAGPGAARAVRVLLDGPAPPCLAGDALVVRGAEIVGTLADPEAELPGLLSAVRRSGRTVEELRLGPPSLEDVFAALTGRELRE